MANTYTAIATVTVGSGGAANIEFTSIPATYTDLLAVFSVRTDAANVKRAFELRVNSGTSNQSSKTLYGDGSSASSSDYGSAIYNNHTIPGANATSSTFSNISVYIPNYASSNNKSISIDGVGENNATEAGTAFSAGLYANSSAVTSILVLPESTGSFVQYSTATLYGIKNS
jgi:hypothetical protein